jgi:hypothetical protein
VEWFCLLSNFKGENMYTFLVLKRSLELWVETTGAPMEIFTDELRPKFILMWSEVYKQY